jgi:hypothetical protein
MPSTYSPLKIQLMATGENNTTWGDVTNLNLGTAIEEAIVGSADVTFASGDVTLTLTDTNASQTARNMRLRCTGTTGGARNLIVPSIEKPYIVKNDCADSVTVKTAAGTGIAVPAGKTMWVYSDGTNVVDAVTHLSSLTLGTDLSVADGGTGASTFTANGLLYGNGSSALQVTAAGTTGQVLVGNTGSAPSWATLTSSAVTSISFGSTGLTPSTPTQGAVTVAGTLGVTNGGTGTSTQFTAGSVVFAGASGVYTQDNTQLFWDNSNDRLGIGTATPSAKLSVVGTAKIGEGAASNSAKLMVNTVSGAAAGIQLFQDGNESWVIENPASTTALTFANSGTERMRITGTGDVGIGTSSPGARLETSVTSAGATAEVLRLSNPGAGANTQAQLNFYTTSTSYATITGGYGASAPQMTFNLPSVTAGNYVWQISSSEKMRLDTSGNLGIGTTSPSVKLEVNGSVRFVDSSAAGPDLLFGNVGGGTSINNVANARTYIGAYETVFTNYDNSSEWMRIDTSGNLLVGTTSAGARLTLGFNTVNGDGLYAINNQNSSYYTLQANGSTGSGVSGWANSTVLEAVPAGSGGLVLGAYSGNMIFQTGARNERMRIDSSGNVGIGTTAPAYALDVSATGNISGQFKTSGSINALYLADAGTTAGTLYIGTVGNDFRVVTGSNEQMRITSAGNVGIGTTAPGYKLAVNGGDILVSRGVGAAAADAAINFGGNANNYIYSGNSSNVMVFATNGSERMRIDSSGNVGIGSSSPSTRLDVWTPGGTATTVRWLQVGVTNYDWRIPASTDAFTLNYGGSTERMRISSTGNVGIGSTTTPAKLTVSDSNASGLEINPTGGVGGGPTVAAYNRTTVAYTSLTTYASAMTWYANGSTRAMDLDSSGNLLVGTTSANGTLSVVGDQISVGSAGGSSSLGIQIKGTTLSAIPAAQVQSYIATGNSSMGVAGDLLIAPRTDVAANIRFITGTSPAERMRITDAGNLQLGTASLATNATNGFPYIPTCAGTPTGTPTAITGYAPMVVDSTNNKLYVYVGGAWQAMN